MNEIAISAPVAQAAPQVKAAASAPQGTAFSEVLSGKVTADTKAVEAKMDVKAADAKPADTKNAMKTDVKETLEKAIALLNSGASTKEIAQTLSAMSDDEAKALLSALEALVSAMSKATEKLAQTSENGGDIVSVISEILSQAKNSTADDESKVSDTIIQQVAAMLQNPASPVMQAQKAPETAVAVSVVSVSPVKAAPTESTAVISISTAQPTEEAAPTAQTAQVAEAPTKVSADAPKAEQVQTAPQTADFKAVQTKLEKLTEAVKTRLDGAKLPTDVKVVEKTTASADDGVKLSAENQVKKLALLGNKVVKNTDEFNELLASVQTTKTAQPTEEVKTVAQPAQIPVEKQVSQTIVNQLSAKEIGTDTQEMTVMLNPKELGEVSIKLVKAGGEITVSIMAQNPATQKLLQERLPTLMANLQTANSEVKDVHIVNPNQNTSAFMNGFSLSDSNSNGGYHARQAHTYTQANVTQQEEISELKEYHEEAKLWQTA